VVTRRCIPSPLGVYHCHSLHQFTSQLKVLLHEAWRLSDHSFYINGITYILVSLQLLTRWYLQLFKVLSYNTSLHDTGEIIPSSFFRVTWASNTLKASGTCWHQSNGSSNTFQFIFFIRYSGGRWDHNLTLNCTLMNVIC
jgi:hypothetical protein